jgi:hypothetical protein
LEVAFQSVSNGFSSGHGIGTTPNCFSADGKTCSQSSDLEVTEVCKSAEPIFGNKYGYGLTGSFGKINGVAATIDGGKTFKHNDMQEPNGLSARFGAFPSTTTWYVAGGLYSAPPSTTTTTTPWSSYFVKEALDYNMHFDIDLDGTMLTLP